MNQNNEALVDGELIQSRFYMKRIIPIIISMIVFCQCNHNLSDITYEGGIPADKSYNPEAESLNDSFLFSWPRDILIIDSLLIVHDSYKQAKGFHIFDKDTGTYLKSFGEKGRGPGEFLEVSSVNYCNDGHSVSVFDPNSKKVITFDIANIMRNVKPHYREYALMKSPNFVKQLIPYGDKFIAKGNSNKMRYGIWDPSAEQFSGIYTDYP